MGEKKLDGFGKSAAINFRTTAEIRERIAISAGANHRSIAQEVEHRLRESFAEQPDLRTIIREEIRAALSDAEEAKRKQILATMNQGYASNSLANQIGLYGRALNSGLQQTYDRSALNGKQS